MKISYDEIRGDTLEIVKEMGRSTNEVPSFFSPIKRIKFHILIYLFFAFSSYFFLPEGSEILIWIGVLFFGFFNWIFLSAYLFGYDYLFSMVRTEKIQNLKLTRIMKKKVRFYGWIWILLLFLLGVTSLLSELNLGALVIGNFVISLIGIFIFNIDIGRYQVASIIGTLGAVKESLK